MFLPRSGLRSNSNIFANSGSIRDNHDFDEDPLAEKPRNVSPGPGQYNSDKSTFKATPKPLNYQFFGSNVERFKTSPTNSEVGPGSYKHNVVKKSDLIASGSA